MYPVDTIKTRMQALGHPGQQAFPLSPRPPFLPTLLSFPIMGPPDHLQIMSPLPVHSSNSLLFTSGTQQSPCNLKMLSRTGRLQAASVSYPVRYHPRYSYMTLVAILIVDGLTGRRLLTPSCVLLLFVTRTAKLNFDHSHAVGVMRLQLHGTSVARAVSAVLRREGWRGLYAGIRAQLLGTGCEPMSAHPLVPCN